MANVTEPSPIKPLWPVRRERRQGQRQKPTEQEDNREKQGERVPGGGDTPIIDDYA